MTEHIGKLVQQTETYSSETHGKIVNAFFNDNQYSEGVVILDGMKPVGIITRNDFYQKIGSQFGYTIYMTRPVSLIMNNNPLVVEADTDVNEVVFLALKREQSNLYDPLVVTEKGEYTGIVSIKLFLIELTRQREKEIDLLIQQQNILKMANEAEIRHGLIVEEKNQLLSAKNLAIKNLLDNAGQGFLSFGRDMIISDEYSYECIRIFGEPIEKRNFLELMDGCLEPGQAEIVSQVFENVFRDIPVSKVRAYLSLLPGEINIRGRNILVDSKLIPDLPGSKVMLILTDITEKKELELQMAREKENLKLIIRAISNNSDISACMEKMGEFFRSGAREIVESGNDTKEKLFEIYRAIHTFKGDFSQLCMYNTSKELHSLEDTLSRMTEDIGKLDDDALLRFIDGLRYESIPESDLKIISDALGEAYFSKGETIAVDKEKILGIEATIQKCIPADLQGLVLPLIKGLRYTSYKDIVRSYNDYIKTIAANSDKCIADLVITGDDIYIDKESYQGFSATLVHILKNMADHGIETVEERFAAGKPGEGRIECEFRLAGAKAFCLYIRDDGRGIDYTKIRNILQEGNRNTAKEHAEPTADELHEAIFADGFSTGGSVGLVSGRGIGLGAVRAEIIKLGGEISVASWPGRGTEFSIRLPLL